MTTRKKTAKSEGPAKTKTLTLHMETLEKLTSSPRACNVRRGARGPIKCSAAGAGCTFPGGEK